MDEKKTAIEMLEDGMTLEMAASYVGATVEQVKEWRAEAYTKDPILALMHKGMTCAEIAKEIGCTPETARSMVVLAWKKEKEKR